MNDLQREQRRLDLEEARFAARYVTDGARRLFIESNARLYTHVRAKCADCGGSGIDIGGIREDDREDCPTCYGSGFEGESSIVRVASASEGRNWLREAFEIVAGKSEVPVEKEHLAVVVEHCRALVSAAFTLPEVA